MERNKKFCQTCLSSGRTMQPFAKLKHLLKELNLEIQDTGAVCWECRRAMDKFYRFKIQVSEAQQLLHRQGEMLDLPSLSRLNVGPNHCYDSLKFFPSSWDNLPKDVVIKQEPIDVDEYSTNDDEMANDFIQPLDRNVTFENNVISVEREPAVWSELPKITLVESISENRNCVTDLTTNEPQPAQPTPAQANIQNVVNSEQNITLSDNSGVIDVEAVQIIVIKEEVLDPKEQESDGNNTQNPEGNDESSILRCKQELDGKSRADNVALDRAIWKKSALHICNSLREHKYASCFQRPITDDIAPEYSKIVRRPMDLATIKRNIKNDVIRTTPEFERVVLLMLTNALMYNSSDHYVYDMTKDFYQEAQNQLELLLSINARPTSVPITRTKRRLEEIENTAKRPKIFNTTPISQLTNMTPKLPRGILNTAKSAKKQKPPTTPITPSSLQTTPSINIKKELAIVIPKLELTEFTIKRKPGRPFKSKQLNTPIQMKKEIPQSTRKSERLRIKKEPKEIVIQKTEPKCKKRKSNKTYKDDGNDYYLDDLSVAITAENAKDFKEQANFIKRLLEETIRSLALNAENFAPKFRGEPIISDGVIKLWCEDRNTLKWLTDTVKKLPSKLGRLSVIRQVDLPKKLQSALSVPGSENDEVIKKVLKVQNPWAQIDTWSFYSAEQRGDNMFFLLGIPSTVIPVLLARQRRLAYNLGSVFVQFFSGAGTLSETPELAWL